MSLIKKNQGFSLIEVLVTILLTTIGILGMVALQGKSIQYTQDAVHRNAAIALTDELVGIMRANASELFNKKPPHEPMYSQLLETTAFYKADGSFDFNAGNCKVPAQTAKEQAGCWLESVQASLPEASSAEIASYFIVCPSYEFDDGQPKCAGSDYAGSTMAIQLAWRGKEGACGHGEKLDICLYNTRVEL